MTRDSTKVRLARQQALEQAAQIATEYGTAAYKRRLQIERHHPRDAERLVAIQDIADGIAAAIHALQIEEKK